LVNGVAVNVRVDIDRVSRLLFDVAAEEVLPRFGRLAAHEVERKPTDETGSSPPLEERIEP
jgi:hypothetical protein